MGYLQVCHVVGSSMGCLLAQLQLLLAVSNLFLQLTHTPHAIIGLQSMSLCVTLEQPLSLLSAMPFSRWECKCEVHACSWQHPSLIAAIQCASVCSATHLDQQKDNADGMQAMTVIMHGSLFTMNAGAADCNW